MTAGSSQHVLGVGIYDLPDWRITSTHGNLNLYDVHQQRHVADVDAPASELLIGS